MNTNKILTSLAASAVLALAAGSAHADTYLFDLTGQGLDATWELDSTTAVSSGVGGSYQVNDVPVSYSGGAPVPTIIDFLDSTYGGGPFVGPGIFLQGVLFANSALLFTDNGDGTITFNAPTTYSLTQAITGAPYSLAVSDVTAVPEPTNIALLLGGLGLFGTMAARRRNAK
jgi:hypothetical protein